VHQPFDVRSRTFVRGLFVLAAGGDLPCIGDVTISDDHQLIGQVDRRADMIWDHFDCLAEGESGIIFRNDDHGGGKFQPR
jgi:hypothetical protein